MPLKVISLEELMNDYRMVHLVEVLNSIVLLRRQCESKDPSGLVKEDSAIQCLFDDVVQTCKTQCELLEMDRPRYPLGSLIARSSGGVLTFGNLVIELGKVYSDMTYDLSSRRFAYVPLERANKYDSVLHEDWSTIRARFPASTKDTQDATDSYLLGLYTACVFHSMRLAEAGLRELASQLNVTITDRGKEVPIEFGTWDKVITQIKSEINKAHTLPKDAEREQELCFYSDMADRCGYIKDLWRNPVSHARKSYNKGEAWGCIERVREFMSLLASERGTHIDQDKGN